MQKKTCNFTLLLLNAIILFIFEFNSNFSIYNIIILYSNFIILIKFNPLKKDMKHLKFIARTVLVENNQVDQAVKALNRVLSNEKVIEQFKRWQYYEKPFERRNRLSFEKCAEIYGGEVERKVKFIVRKNRENPYPWD